jgi:hypothetical protein
MNRIDDAEKISNEENENQIPQAQILASPMLCVVNKK